ncbi:MAG: hypothetical protein C5B48_04210 [Candidatus Rokuibacteriota bacterium]|nr:MAG: hypothetical protein C5B48_04210 [Candidatus Rokubacteria bacterium]
MQAHTLVRKRTLLAGGAAAVVAALLVPFTALGGTTRATSAKDASLQRLANLYEIDQIEVKFHRATSTHNLKLMMSLWASGAVFNIDEQTLTGKAQIKNWFATESKAFMPGNHWESDTPTYKDWIHLNGDQAKMYFECHYIDPATSKVVALAGVTHTLQKINGKWLITNSAGSYAKLHA